MRILIFFIVGVTLTVPSLGQSPGDSVVVEDGDIKKKPFFAAESVHDLSWGDTVRVIDQSGEYSRDRYLRVFREGEEGWLNKTEIMSGEALNDYRRDLGRVGTTIVQGGMLKESPSNTGEPLEWILRGDTVSVVEVSEDHFRVNYDGGEGWLEKEGIMSKEEERKYREKVEAQRRQARQKRKKQKEQARQRKRYFETLQEKGYTVVLRRQTFEKNTADGVSVGLEIVNISESKTIKYARITWKLFNSVGDLALGNNSGSATARTRFVGPIEPGESGYVEFENVWYNSVGTCAQIRRIEVEHIDGSSFTYLSDLKDIAQEAETVRLRGDCSYEAQQQRED